MPTHIEFQATTRRPDLAGAHIDFHYLREVEVDDETGDVVAQIARHPQACRVAGGPWVTDPAFVVPLTEGLFERDAIYAQAMQAIAPHLPPPGEDGREVLVTRRLDVGDAVVIGLSATGLTEEDLLQLGAAISSALLAECADDLAAGRLSALWAG